MAVSVSPFMMLFSANPAGQTEDNLRFLYGRATRVKWLQDEALWLPYRQRGSGALDFWVGGWQLA
jgi:hypothetical protein